VLHTSSRKIRAAGSQRPVQSSVTLFIAILAGLGLAQILAVFPFHTWIPMLAESINPYAAAFVFFVFPTTVLFLLLDYVTRLVSLGSMPNFPHHFEALWPDRSFYWRGIVSL